MTKVNSLVNQVLMSIVTAVRFTIKELEPFNPNRSLGPISSGDVKVFSCSPESKECLALIHGSHKT